MIFGSLEGRKSIKNLPETYQKPYLNAILDEDAKQLPEITQKVPITSPKSTQVGAVLGSKTVMDPPKSEAKTMSKKCLQKVDFLTHFGPDKAKKNVPAASTRTVDGL